VTTTELTVDTTLPGHREAMTLGDTEYQRFIDLLHRLEPDDWSQPTECPPWDVRAMVAHNIGNMSANASMREMAHQMRTANKRAKANGTQMIDELTALQISERSSMTPKDLLVTITALAPRAVAGRRKTPGLLRRSVKVYAPPPYDRMTLGFLIDTVFTRDVWMHRVDICRATGKEMALTAEHDGRIVAAMVGDWAARHGMAYHLVLEGPAGGSFSHGSDGERLHLDAVQFARILSGRDAAGASGLLATGVLF
jgi:uncharacterized protein (TIGR03083 family)